MATSMRIAVAGVAALAVVLVAGFLIANRPPAIPEDAATTVVARTHVEGPIAPNVPPGDVDPEAPLQGPRSPNGSDCLARVQRDGGWADVCWAVTRNPGDGDPVKDYYDLRIDGSFEGLRWLLVRADLDGQPGDGAYDTWPDGTIVGDCHQEQVSVGLTVGLPPMADVCGHATGTMETGWVQTLTWTCERCLFPDDSTKALSMRGFVGVPAGEVPAWDLYIDGGT